jgi:hypothetical protein
MMSAGQLRCVGLGWAGAAERFASKQGFNTKDTENHGGTRRKLELRFARVGRFRPGVLRVENLAFWRRCRGRVA